jgi:RNA polymerase sigma-70 factor (ECF subfamily)
MGIEDRSEGALIQLSIEGDAEAFEVLYRRHMDPIYRYFYFRVGDQNLAEDLTEDVFLRAWEALPYFNVGRRPLLHWMYTIAHNLLVDHFRKRQPQPLSDDMMARFQAPAETPEGVVSREQELDAILGAIRRLDEVERQVILLRFVEGLRHREIGKIIDKSTAASRVIQHRALKTLRAFLQELRPGDD